MNPTHPSDPFNESPSTGGTNPPINTSQPSNLPPNTSSYPSAPTWGQPSFTAASAFANPSYPGFQPTYTTPNYTTAPYSYSSYAAPYSSTYPTPGFARPAQQLASNARETSAAVLSGMHDAMSRFARVSAMIEDVLRNLHMLFDAIFGLGYSLGAFREEARLWLAIKTGPVAYIARLFSRAMTVWRLLCLFFMSPMAGRFSPVALVLRILGLVPEDDPLDVPLTDLWRRVEDRSSQQEGVNQDEENQQQGGLEQGDVSNL